MAIGLHRPSLEPLLLTARRQVQQLPGGLWIELVLVAAQHPHVVHPNHFGLMERLLQNVKEMKKLPTYRVTFDNLSLGISDDHNLLRLEGDDQHRTLLHHLAHRKLFERNCYIVEI